jgi:putative membrane protein
MALASAGAFIAVLVNAYLRRDFARELQESMRVKRGKPLGEDEIARLWRSK